MLRAMLSRALRQVRGQLSASVDKAIYKALLSRSDRSRRGSRAESLGHAERVEALARIALLYPEPSPENDDAFFSAPSAPRVDVRRVRPHEGLAGEVLDLRWTSGYEPYVPQVRERFLEATANLTCHARLFAHRDAPRPTVIAIHGYLGGNFAVEERFFPVDDLFAQGLDVALFALPFHGARNDRPLARPRFPASDPRITVEGFRQAMWDLRSLLRFLVQRGARSVGALGMSLGGYTTALLSTVEPDLAFAVPLIPLASLADFAREGGRLVGTPAEQEAQHRALEQAFRVVSPLARPPRIDPKHIVVVAGEADQITPIEHAEKLARHLGGALSTFEGGHLLQLGRSEAFRPVYRIVSRLL